MDTQGIQGQTGLQGRNGARGAQGETGIQGIPGVSSTISFVKGVEVIIQSIIGFLVSYAVIKLENKFGVKIDATVQVQTTMALMVVITGIVHGMQNYIVHRWPRLDILKIKQSA